MDIAALSSGLAMTQVNSDIGVAMLSKQLDLVEDMGNGMQKMMEASVQPNLGQQIDISV